MIRPVALAAAVATIAFAAPPSPPPFARAATESCLLRLPHTVEGLPPARPPTPPLLFVKALRRDAISTWNPAAAGRPRRHTQLGVWSGNDGIILSFFKDAADALVSRKPLGGLYGGTRVRNVLVTWDQPKAPPRSMRNAVVGCLRAHARRATLRTPPHATLATFIGTWGGHTRGLRIRADGRAVESTYDGCCHHVYEMHFQIVSVRGTLTHARATYRVTWFKRFAREGPRSRVGQVGRLVLRDGIVTNTLTTVFFCSNPAWGATGACGA